MPRNHCSNIAKTGIVTLALTLATYTALAQRAQSPNAEAVARAREQVLAQERELEEALRAAQQPQQEDAPFGRRGTRAPARGRRGGAFGNLEAGFPEAGQFPMESGSTGTSDVTSSKEPKDLIAIDVWVINIEMPRAKGADDMVADVVQRANDLPPIVSRDEVRVLLGRLAVAGVLRRSREYQLLGANGQTARAQTGVTQPSITSTTVANRGRVNSFTYRDVGTIIQAVPTILPNGSLQLNFSYQSSEVQKTTPPVIIADMADGDPLTADQINQQSITTNIQLKRGTAAVVQRDVQADPTNDAAIVRSQLVIVAANVLPPQN